MKFSVIIPVFNDFDRLEHCVEALLGQQTEETFELLVVDNGSQPPLPLNSWADPKVRILSEPSPGSYAARNRGVGAAQGEVLLFVDADCLPEPDWIRRAGEALSRTGADLVAGKVELYAANPERPNAAELFDMLCGLDQRRAVSRDHAFTANLAVRRRVMDQLQGFNASATSGSDVELTRRAVTQGFTLAYCDRMLVRHPARNSLSEYRRKIRRLVSGSYQLRDESEYFRSSFTLLRILGNCLRPPLTAMRVYHCDRAAPFSWLQRFKAIAVLFHNKYYMQWLRVEYRFGLQSEQYR
ncbi:glycosyltransferase [Ferrimonas balearica]|uniref:glycosyltransferase n=1 Tax=Ferrimonas balearica TaxID=44012 RepID=UPI001C99AD79|nr:glycosyltransferase family A protein [Ferrimonas balearica]MBY5994264.1 glycosyltransferase family 2 protein [Ferrimonas balearica]